LPGPGVVDCPGDLLGSGVEDYPGDLPATGVEDSSGDLRSLGVADSAEVGDSRGLGVVFVRGRPGPQNHCNFWPCPNFPPHPGQWPGAVCFFFQPLPLSPSRPRPRSMP